MSATLSYPKPWLGSNTRRSSQPPPGNGWTATRRNTRHRGAWQRDYAMTPVHITPSGRPVTAGVAAAGAVQTTATATGLPAQRQQQQLLAERAVGRMRTTNDDGYRLPVGEPSAHLNNVILATHRIYDPLQRRLGQRDHTRPRSRPVPRTTDGLVCFR